jgi:hypothetical protein
MTESTKLDTEMPPDTLDSATTHARRGILWLVVAHVAVGVFASAWENSVGITTDLARGALSGLWFGQNGLLGIWCGLGTSRHWKRLVGGIIGVIVIHRMAGIGNGDLSMQSLVILLVATAFVATPLLITRSFHTMIHMDGLPSNRANRLQFSIRQLLLMTFMVACVVALGKVVQPHIPPWLSLVYIAVFAGLFILCGVVPAWLMLASKRPVSYGIGLVAMAACAGYYLGLSRYLGMTVSGMIAFVATSMSVVVVSLLVVRRCGYRLVQLPKSTPRGGGLEETTKPENENPDSQSSSLSQ